MREPTNEELFQRFVERRDTRALGQIFDRVGPELLTVAGHLARGSVEAEDLVQQTFVAAIEGADRYDPTRPLLPWMVGILTRGARYRARQEARRPEPARLGWAPVAFDPQRASEEEELTRVLSGALDDIAPTYGEVLRRHLLDGLAPREIAAALGRAPGTVRVQLHRGLELLRENLPASLAPGAALGGAAWVQAALPELRRTVLSSAKQLGAGSTTSLLGLKSGVAIAVVLLTGGLMSQVGGGPAVGPDAEGVLELTHPVAELVEGNGAMGTSLSAAAGEDRVARAEVAEVEGLPRRSRVHVLGSTGDQGAVLDGERWVVEGRVRAQGGPIDLSETVIQVRSQGEDLVTTKAEADGRYQLGLPGEVGTDGQLTRTLLLRFDHPDHAIGFDELSRRSAPRTTPATVDEPRTHVFTVHQHLFEPYMILEGTLDSGALAAHAALFPMGRRDEPVPRAVDETGLPDNNYRLRVPSPGRYLLVADADGRIPAARDLVLERRGSTERLEPLLLDHGRELNLRVDLPLDTDPKDCVLEFLDARDQRSVDPTRPLSWFARQARGQLGWRNLAYDRGGIRRVFQEEGFGIEGTVHLKGVAHTSYVASVRNVPGLRPGDAAGRTPIRADDSYVDVVPRVALQRVLVHHRVNLLPEAKVTLWIGHREPVTVALNSHAVGELRVPANVMVVWQAECAGFLPRAGVAHAAGPGHERTLDLLMEPATAGLAGVVIEAPAEVTELDLIWSLDGKPDQFRRTVPVEGSLAHLTGLPPGTLHLAPVHGADFRFANIVLEAEGGKTHRAEARRLVRAELHLHFDPPLPPGEVVADFGDLRRFALEPNFRDEHGVHLGLQLRGSRVRCPLWVGEGETRLVLRDLEGMVLWEDELEITADGEPERTIRLDLGR